MYSGPDRKCNLYLFFDLYEGHFPSPTSRSERPVGCEPVAKRTAQPEPAYRLQRRVFFQYCVRTRNGTRKVGIGKGSCCSQIGIQRRYSCGWSSSSSPDHREVASTVWLGNYSTERSAVQPGDMYTTMCFHLAGHMDEDPQPSAACTNCLERVRQQSIGSGLDVSQSDVSWLKRAAVEKSTVIARFKGGRRLMPCCLKAH